MCLTVTIYMHFLSCWIRLHTEAFFQFLEQCVLRFTGYVLLYGKKTVRKNVKVKLSWYAVFKLLGAVPLFIYI
jgi:hypothetical protein